MILLFFVINIIKATIKVYKLSSEKLSFSFNKVWVISAIVIFVNSLNDITYYDGRISLITWLIFAGSASTLNENEKPLEISDL